MDTFTKQGLILAATFVAALGILLVVTKSNTPTTEGGVPTELINQASPDEGDSSAGDSLTPEQRAQGRIDPKKWLAAEAGEGIPNTLDLSLLGAPKELSAKAIKFPLDGKDINVSIRIISTERCMVGDLDAIVREASLDTSAKFLLSIEPLTGSDKDFGPASKTTLDPRGLDSTQTFTLKIPVGENPEHLGLFICRDAAGSGKCREKDAVDIGKLLSDHMHMKATAADRIYYFQYLLLDHNTLTVVGGDVEPTSGAAFSGYLTSRTGNALGAGSAADAAATLNATIRSATVTLKDFFIELDLPRSQPGKCPGGGPMRVPVEKIMDQKGITPATK